MEPTAADKGKGADKQTDSQSDAWTQTQFKNSVSESVFVDAAAIERKRRVQKQTNMATESNK